MTRYHPDLGDGDTGTALRAAMSACVSDIRMPASTLDSAVRRDRKRKTRIRLTSAAGVTVAAATAIAIAAVPGRPGHVAAARPAAGPRMQTAAYVLNRTAAAQVNSYRMISVDHSPSGLLYTDVATQQQRIVSALRDSSGQPYFQIATAIGGGAYTETTIDYQHHVYSTFTTSSMDNGAQVTLSSFLPLQSNSDPAVAFRQALQAGIITVVGQRSLDGRDTILIRVKPTDKSGAPTYKSGAKPGTQPPPSLVWIDASTYLVVQTEHFVAVSQNTPTAVFPNNHNPSAPGSKVAWQAIVDHVTWLSPTPQNRALLTVTPPAGFTKIPYSELAQKYLGPIS